MKQKLEEIVEFHKNTEKNFLNYIESSDLTANTLKEINSIFKIFFENLAKHDTIWESLFLRRSWSLYLSAIRIGTGGQSPDVYPLIRTMLECALYAWYIKKNPNYLNIWLRRIKSKEDHKIMRNIFSYGKIINELEKEEEIIAKLVKNSYEFQIDFGAHPNFSSITSGIKEKEPLGTFEFTFIHNQNENSFHLAMEKIAQAGIEALQLFRISLSHKLASTSLDQKICKIMMDLDRNKF